MTAEAETGVSFPFVTAPLISWAQDVAATPSNGTQKAFTLRPGDDTTTAFSTEGAVIDLLPGAEYHWHRENISTTVTIRGNGATVRNARPVSGPCIFIRSTTGSPMNLRVSLEDIIFKGYEDPDRASPMSNTASQNCAVWIHQAWKATVLRCTFINWRGAALWFSDTTTYWSSQQWSQQHMVCQNRFEGCRICIANTGGSEYSLASNNCFFDCQIAFNVIGGNWNRCGNVIVNCRCAYLHARNNMWFAGSSGVFNAAHDTFVGNVLNHCDYGGNRWPTVLTMANGSQIQLAAFYFDNTGAYPPLWCGNTQYYGDMKLLNYNSGGMKAWVISGCIFMAGSNSMPTAGNITVSNGGDKVYLIGCSSNASVQVTGIAAANMTPSVGTIVAAGTGKKQAEQASPAVPSPAAEEPLSEAAPQKKKPRIKRKKTV